MVLSQYNRIFFLFFILILLLCSCGDSDESEEVTQTPPAESTMTINIKNQNLIEQEATKSLNSVSTEGSFAFETQRMVSVDLIFLTTQFQEKISIYSAIDHNSNTPENLLEQGTIVQSNNYKSMLVVASALSTLTVVRNDDFSNSVEITINSNDLLTHTFQE